MVAELLSKGRQEMSDIDDRLVIYKKGNICHSWRMKTKW
jgi:hypothetical protein